MTARRRTRIAGERRFSNRPTRSQPLKVTSQWWVGFKLHHRYTWPVEVLFTLALASVIAGVQLWVEENRADRQEVLANVTFIRETLRDNPNGMKNFRGMNLREADLSELDLGCDVRIIGLDTLLYQVTDGPVLVEGDNEPPCADFSGADFTGAQIDGTDLTGARLVDVVLNDIDAEFVSAAGALINPIEMNNVQLTQSDLRGATLIAGPGNSKGEGSTIDLTLFAVDISGAEVKGRGSVDISDVTGRHVDLDGVKINCYDEIVAAEGPVDALVNADCGNGFTTIQSKHVIEPIDLRPSTPGN